MKVYIAGKITGDSSYRKKFQQAQRELEAEGFIVLNPAELPEGMHPSDYMRICFAMMDCADVVAFLPDYSQSRGARLEFDWCQYTGKQTMCLWEGTEELSESDLVHRKEILDKMDKWMCAVKRNLYPGLTKATILDTLAYVIEKIQAVKSISQKQSNVSGGANDETI